MSLCLDRKGIRVTFPVYTRSEHLPLTYQSSVHGAVSDSKADQLRIDADAPKRRRMNRTPISISQTPSTHIFDNSLMEFATVTPSALRSRLQREVTSSSSLSSQPRREETRHRHWLPDSVTSSGLSSQWRRNDMLKHFAVRRPQVKWKRPVRLPPTNSERCLKNPVVYQSRSQLSQLASSNHAVSSFN